MKPAKKIRVAIIVDNAKIGKWQLDALQHASDLIEVVAVLSCQNTIRCRDFRKRGLYFVLNYFSLQSAYTRKVEYKPHAAEMINFHADYLGNWQVIPSSVVEVLDQKRIDIIVKFGMGLLKSDVNVSKYDILSYHHGDSSAKRGRPAGFYELLQNRKRTEVIVQSITDVVGVGKIYAFGESKNVMHSYRRTALNVYKLQRYLLRKAIKNYSARRILPVMCSGKEYRLPDNGTVIKVCVRLAYRVSKKIFYGLFYEKKWNVVVVENTIDTEIDNIINIDPKRRIKIASEYTFYADPFFSPDGKSIRFEALNRKTGRGEILEMPFPSVSKAEALKAGGHYSFPFSFANSGVDYFMPETASHSPQAIYKRKGLSQQKIVLKGVEHLRLVDAVLLLHDDHWYLFGGQKGESYSVLHLWVGDDLGGLFRSHPSSPICLSPRYARMAGGVIESKRGLYRVGQNNEGEYGASLSILKITELTPYTYSEVPCGSVSFDRLSGPHTFSKHPYANQVAMDYYTNAFSIMAGVRRLRAKLNL